MRNLDGAVIVAGVEVPYARHPQGAATGDLLARAFGEALAEAGIAHGEVDGLGVSSFTLGPDHAVDLAWRLGIAPRWLMDDCLGGASGIDLLQHALRAIQAGDASVVVLASGDHFEPADFTRLTEHYNLTTRTWLRPLDAGVPNSLFAMLTSRHMRAHGLDRADYGALAVTQRQWAAMNPRAVYRSPMTLDDYLAAPMVSDPLGRFDCVPVVSGADAIVLVAADHPAARGRAVRLRALRSRYNRDHQEGDGLVTGLADIARPLWDDAGLGPDEVDLVSVYDDYPVMVLIQLADLGFAADGDLRSLVHSRIATRALPVNTSGGQLSAGQAGAAGGMHGLVEAVTQLRGTTGERQVAGARIAAVTGYGMVEYRYGMCANAVVLEGVR
ncbi:MAG: thiolase family protein [Burkholderiales bacterium]|nr:thiolase family protein [Burkholderiales bacterium]OJX02385.1 MAG: DitF protein [Burkholderiales bacterium 70-64]